MVRGLLAALAVLLAVGGLWPAPAGALSCIRAEEILPELDLVVEGRILDVPEPGRVVLLVHRYFKGFGPGRLEAAAEGWSEGDFRMNGRAGIPQVGDRVLVGLRNEGGALVSRICDPFMIMGVADPIPPLITDRFGEGRAPEGNAGPEEWDAGGSDEAPGEAGADGGVASGVPWRSALLLGGGAALVLGAAVLVLALVRSGRR